MKGKMNLLPHTLLLINLATATPVFPADPDADLRRFFGTYVGRAEEVALDDRARVERDIDLDPAPFAGPGIRRIRICRIAPAC